MISWYLPSYLIDSIDIVRYCIFSERFKANKEVEQGPLCGWWASVQVRCVVENKKSNHASCVLTTHDLWMRTRKGNLSSPPIFHRRGLGGAAEWNRLTRTVIPFCVCAKSGFRSTSFSEKAVRLEKKPSAVSANTKKITTVFFRRFSPKPS